MAENVEKTEEKAEVKTPEIKQEATQTPEQTPEQKQEVTTQPNPEVEALKKEVAELRRYQEQATPLINAVYSDPDIQSVIKQKSTATPSENTSGQQGNSNVDKKLQEIDLASRANIITEFDRRFGIKPEEQEEVHKKMALELQSLGQDARTAPLDRLGNLLEKSFKLSNEDRYNNIAKAQGAAETMNTLNSQFPNQSGRSLTNSDGSTQLTNEQKEWVDKLVAPSDKKSAQDKAQEVLKKHPA